MRFSFEKPKENIVVLARTLGYRLIKADSEGESNLIRLLGGDYPRFHLYLRDNGQNLEFNLHLDQKRPSYGQETRHSGEYDGEIIEAEAQRIKAKLASLL